MARRKGVVALRSSALKMDLKRVGYKAREVPKPLSEFPVEQLRSGVPADDPIEICEAKLLGAGDSYGERGVVEGGGIRCVLGAFAREPVRVGGKGKGRAVVSLPGKIFVRSD